MRAFLEKYGLALFVLVVLGIMIALGPMIGDTISNRTQNEVNKLTVLGDEMTTEPLVAGTYDADWNLLKTWDELGIDIETDFSSGSANTTVAKLGDAKKLVISEGVTKIGSHQLYGASQLEEIIIPDGVTSIGLKAFTGCSSLTSITIPDGVTSIGSGTFNYCSSLTSIHIPDRVTSIGNGAFFACNSLTSINIPDSVTSIGSSAFKKCTNLTTIYYSGKASGAPWGATNATVVP